METAEGSVSRTAGATSWQEALGGKMDSQGNGPEGKSHLEGWINRQKNHVRLLVSPKALEILPILPNAFKT